MTVWRTLRASWPVQALAVASLVKLLFSFSGPAVQSLAVVGLLDAVATIVIAASLGYFLVRLVVRLQRRLLWRVRRKLILSYVFIGFIPVILIVSFFVLVGTLSLLSVSSFLVKLRVDELVSDASAAATAMSRSLRAAPDPDVEAVLTRQLGAIQERYPDASAVMLGAEEAPIPVGTWTHGERPAALPPWVGPDGFAGLVALQGNPVRLVARAARRLGPAAAGPALVVDVPLGDATSGRIRAATGIELHETSIILIDETPATADLDEETVIAAPSGSAPASIGTSGGLSWISFLEHTDWASGERRFLNLQIQVPPRAFYQRVLSSQANIGDVSVGYAFLVALAAVGVLFLVIEFAALVMGFALAKSITGSVHELFIGTEHVRRGDFTHRIRVKTRDQLGELAESFNAMTGSVEDLLQQAAEKKRLEEELRIAREIQMSLLPRDVATVPGLAVTAVCIPAREVGGDYYDFIRLGDQRLGVLVADVSGKGTSAAFYMAELKGLILSLGQIYQSPRQLLIEVNRIIAAHIDNRSFITMTYAVFDLENRTLTYARAGHTPLIYLSPDGAEVSAQVLIPNGLVVGLNLEGFEKKFEELLEEQTLPIRHGDVAVLFTDGITEAMNEESDLFGEDRLSQLVEEHSALSSEELRERILRDVEAFVGSADQHDDMTMVLLKIEGAPVTTGVERVASALA